MKNASSNRLNVMKWVIWTVIVMAYAVTFFHSLSMGVIKESLIAEFGINETTIVNIGNAFFYTYLLMQIPTGLLVDTMGARKVAGLGSLIAGIGITIFSFSTSVPLLFVGRAMVGLGTSVVFVSILKIQSTWFEDAKFGTMTGITCFIGTLGGAVAQTPLAMFVGQVGWRVATRSIGFLSFAIALLIFLVVRNRPEDMGMVGPNPSTADGKSPSIVEIMKGLFAVLKNPRTWPIFIMYGAFYGTYVVITGYYGISFFTEVYGKSTIDAANFITVAVIGSAIGAVIIGNMSDKLQSRKKPMLIAGVLYAACWAGLVYINGGMPPEGFMMPLMFFIGFMSCAYVVSWPAVKEVNDPKYVGVSTSVANIGGFLGSIVIPPMVASVLANRGTQAPVEVYHQAFFIVLIATIVGLVVSVFAKETGCKNIYDQSKKEAA